MGKSSHFRKNKTYRRVRGRIEPAKKVLIVCEDEKSAPLYFRELCRDLQILVFIEICGEECGSAPINVVDYAIKRKGENFKARGNPHFENIWCVMDVDKHTTLAKAINKAKGNKIAVALSNPCIEYWFLLHFRKTSKYFSSPDQVVLELKKHVPQYDKGFAIYSVISDKTEIALSRAVELFKTRSSEETVVTLNSSTDVHLLMNQLGEISKKPYT